MRDADRRDERGFTLVEVLAALLILTFVITSSLWAFLERNKRLQQASEIVLAYQALANEAEYLRRHDFKTLEAYGDTFQSLSDTTLLVPLAPYGTAVKVEVLKPGVKNVTMTVRWHNGEREARLGLIRVDTGDPGGRSLF
jgi:prepilin-type N-terminal cleavage/methylation domain-containing protein